MGTLPSKKLAPVVERLAEIFAIDCFIETGTFRGETTRWAAQRFADVQTIEINAETLAATKAALAETMPEQVNITYHLGDSRTALPGIVATLDGPAVFWLDAHKGGGFFGKGNDCPILEEIDAINTGAHDCVLLIDDARGFLSPPPPPFNWNAWPDLRTILNRACETPERFAVIFDDVIVCVPMRMREALRDQLHRIKPKL